MKVDEYYLQRIDWRVKTLLKLQVKGVDLVLQIIWTRNGSLYSVDVERWLENDCEVSSIGLEGDGSVTKMGLVLGILIIDVQVYGFCDVCESILGGNDLRIG